MTERVHIREVGPRDGLQLIAKMLTSEQKLKGAVAPVTRH